MGFFMDLALIKGINEKKSDKEFDYPHDHLFRRYDLCNCYTPYKATDMIYAEPDWTLI